VTRLADLKPTNKLNMKKYMTTSIGRLRLLAFLEGVSLLLLVLIAVPVKYGFNNPFLVKLIGPIHGVLFLFFVYFTWQVSQALHWKFWESTWKVLLASFIPFCTFYIDHKMLRHLQAADN
jgi:integral membrane protein